DNGGGSGVDGGGDDGSGDGGSGGDGGGDDGSGDGGSGDNGGTLTGDDARRAVLSDISEQIILPSLQDFETQATAMETAVAEYAAAPADESLRDAARAAWSNAMDSWQHNEVLQIGPAGRSQNPDAVLGGQDFRELIYSWPFTLDTCGLETAASNGDAVDGTTSIDITGLGALEYMLFTDAASESCSDQPDTAARAAHSERLAARIVVLADSLENRWNSAGGNYVNQWNTAGDGSVTYATPQDALDALSIAMFYVEKETKDRKVGLTTGVGATGLTCGNPSSCPEFLESRLSNRSGENLAANFETLRDLFTGTNGGMGVNDLLIGIDREDLATKVIAEIDIVLASIAAIESDTGFEAAVEAIADRNECVNAFSNSTGLAPCALLGEMKTALDTFRIDIVGALSLAIPDSAAGDND
ncbi:MAG: imelysin family protein, partial [Pseudomonadales bacterium]|nr:imelysin family protein [Pseudomonadales bacterium]